MKHIIIVLFAVMLIACGADITDPQDGSFDDNDNTNTVINNGTIINSSDLPDDETAYTLAQSAWLQYRCDTLHVIDTVYQRDTLAVIDTMLITTVVIDTIDHITHDTIRTVIVDTVQTIDLVHDTVYTTILDTLVQTKVDTITEIQTVRDTVRLLKRDTVTVADTTYLSELKGKFSSLPKYINTANIDENWYATLTTERVKTYVDAYRYNTYLKLTRKEGSPVFNKKLQITYLGAPKIYTGDASYTWSNTNAEDTTCLVNVMFSLNNTYTIADPQYPGYSSLPSTLYDNCLIIKEIRTCNTDACIAAGKSRTVSPRSEAIFDEVLWKGEIKLCKS